MLAVLADAALAALLLLEMGPGRMRKCANTVGGELLCWMGTMLPRRVLVPSVRSDELSAGLNMPSPESALRYMLRTTGKKKGTKSGLWWCDVGPMEIQQYVMGCETPAFRLGLGLLFLAIDALIGFWYDGILPTRRAAQTPA